jgi:hypothetical protein
MPRKLSRTSCGSEYDENSIDPSITRDAAKGEAHTGTCSFDRNDPSVGRSTTRCTVRPAACWRRLLRAHEAQQGVLHSMKNKNLAGTRTSRLSPSLDWPRPTAVGRSRRPPSSGCACRLGTMVVWPNQVCAFRSRRYRILWELGGPRSRLDWGPPELALPCRPHVRIVGAPQETTPCHSLLRAAIPEKVALTTALVASMYEHLPC